MSDYIFDIFETNDDLTYNKNEELAEYKKKELQGAYLSLFTGNGSINEANIVLRDLFITCFGATSTFDINERIHCLNEGKREVLNRILTLSNLSINQIRKGV